MLGQISLLTSLLFVLIYPFCFLISADDPLRNKFHRFHMGTPAVIGGIVLFVLWGNPQVPPQAQYLATAWITVLLALTAYFWNKESPVPWVPAVLNTGFGGALLSILQPMLFPSGAAAMAATVLGGAIFCASLYAMNLGHWYLNVHGLPLKHLIRASYTLGGLLTARLLWDIYIFTTRTVLSQGDQLSLLRFSMTLDGFFLWAAVLFGTVFPLIALYFVLGTLKVRSTQSATGILYVILSGILLGDLTYKYYLLKFQVPL